MVKTNPFETLARDAKGQMCPNLMRAMLLLSRYGSRV
jgi:hypothetical protein